MSLEFTSEGTVVKHNGKTYWFKDNFTFKGVEVPSRHAMTLWESIVGGKLNDFEFGLLMSIPFNGSESITIVSMLKRDPSERNYIKSIKHVTAGYLVRRVANSAGINLGEVIGSEAFYDTDGNRVGHEIKIKNTREPGLQTPLIDPIDIVGGLLADVVKAGGKALLRKLIEAGERRLAANELANLTAKQLKVIPGAPIRTLTAKDLTRVVGGKPEPFLDDGLAHIVGRGPPVPPLALADEYMKSSQFQVNFNALETRLRALEKELPETLREVTRSYDRIPLHFRQSVTPELQRHIETVINVAELRAKLRPNSFVDMQQHLDFLRGAQHPR
jgi:hypothetical protein